MAGRRKGVGEESRPAAGRLPRGWESWSPVLLLAAAFQLTPGPAGIVADAFPAFVDVAAQVGVTLMNLCGLETKDYILEVNGNGAAFFDYDSDGDIDLVVTNGSTMEGIRNGGDPMLALYENLDNRFIDVTADAGLGTVLGWGVGVCAADYDNDGHRDLYLTAYGANVLLRNNGDRTFTDVTSEAGVGDPRWSTNCAFGDYDLDGDVDLYVANYLAFDERIVPRRGETNECRYLDQDVFCGPAGLLPEPDSLYRNEGDGTFTEISAEAGLSAAGYSGFGVVFSDVDGDGWPDIYVANDLMPNLLYRNNGDGTFVETGLLSGTALDDEGREQAGMGVAVGDYNHDGRFDIFVTNFFRDTNTLYRNLGDFFFDDRTLAAGMGGVSFDHLGWGTGFADLDNDGWEDLFVANGHVYPEIDEVDAGGAYGQPKEVYRNMGDGRFEELAPGLGGDLLVAKSARGAAFGDYDNDGDIDIVAVNMNDRPSLYRNEGGNRNGWISFRLEGTRSNRDAIGARLEISVDGTTRVSEVRSGGSYLSHSDTRIHFGLGDAERVDSVRVRWPGGGVEEWPAVAAVRFVTLREGEGRALPEPARR